MTSSNKKLEGANKSPRPGEPVWVQCDGYRCLAFQDKKGKWWSFYDRSNLPGVIKILSTPSPPQ
jgi:hypothetical protein